MIKLCERCFGAVDGEEAAHLLLARLAGETVARPVRDLGFSVIARASA